MISGLIMVISILSSFDSAGANVHRWTNFETNLYNDRKFIELGQLLTITGKKDILTQIEIQMEDLNGCRSLHSGKGGLNQLFQCMSFLNREIKLGFHSPGRTSLVKDMNILCQKMVKAPGLLEKFLQSKVLSPHTKDWAKCQEMAWEQIYLTTYANFEAYPIPTLSFVRTAQRSLPGDNHWNLKTYAHVGIL